MVYSGWVDAINDSPVRATRTWAAFASQVDEHEEIGAQVSPAAFLLSAPNPFDGEATVLYSLPGAGFVTLRVYDLVGREVDRLVDGHREAGRHALVFRPQDLPSGVYLLQLRTDGTALRQKLTYVQ